MTGRLTWGVLVALEVAACGNRTDDFPLSRRAQGGTVAAVPDETPHLDQLDLVCQRLTGGEI